MNANGTRVSTDSPDRPDAAGASPSPGVAMRLPHLTYAQQQALQFLGCCFAAGAVLGALVGVLRLPR